MNGTVRRRIGKALALLVSILLSVLLLEVVMRTYIFGGAAFSYARMKSLHSIGTSGLIRASEHREILYELRPDVRAHYKLHDFHTNSHGMRDQEYERVKPQRTFRVAVVGDSLTMGSGVPIEETYHSILERRLNDGPETTSYEFLNFGVSGYFLSQYVAVIRHKVLEYDPDLVLLGFYAGNDAKITPQERFREPYRVQPTTNGFFDLHSFSLAGDIWKYTIRGKGRRRKKTDPEKRERQLEWVDRNFAEIAAILETHGIPLIVAQLGNKQSNPRRIRELAERNGFTFVDTTARFENTSISDYSIYLTDKHPNGEANRIFADVIQAGLDEHDLLDARDGPTEKPEG